MKRRVFPLVFVLFDLVLFAATYVVLMQARPPRSETTTIDETAAFTDQLVKSEFPTPTLIAISMFESDLGNQFPPGAVPMDRDGVVRQENPVDTITIAQLLENKPPELPGPDTAITTLPELMDIEQVQPKPTAVPIGDLRSVPDLNSDLGILPTRTPSPTPVLPTRVPKAPTPLAVAQAVRAKIVPATVPPPYTSGGEGCAPRGLPVQGILTQHYSGYHPGLDLAVDLGTSVVATHSGMVIFAGWRWDGYGNMVIIQNGRFVTYYAHNTSVAVAVGQIVHAGDIIARSGSTGWSSGPHVHYETHIDNAPVDPMSLEGRHLQSC
jgi:hypothetical protein